MRPLRFLAPILAPLFFTPPAPAWNFVTHRVIAAIAYDQLKPAVRARVDALVKLHPDYAATFAKNAPVEEPARSRAAFIEAAVWADQIRNDARFYDDMNREAAPTPVLPGFPDMKRHTPWHNIDLPLSQDGTSLELPIVPNIVTALDRIMPEISAPNTSQAQRAYDLVWLIHLVGDIHAPLHCVNRCSAEHPKGDLGGNLAFVYAPATTTGITLHKYWDDAVGADTNPEWVVRTVRELEASHPAAKITKRTQGFDPAAWAQESLVIARKDIYAFGTANGSREQPLSLPAGYQENAHLIAEIQVDKAASRLAAFLNARLKY